MALQWPSIAKKIKAKAKKSAEMRVGEYVRKFACYKLFISKLSQPCDIKSFEHLELQAEEVWAQNQRPQRNSGGAERHLF